MLRIKRCVAENVIHARIQKILSEGGPFLTFFFFFFFFFWLMRGGRIQIPL